MAMENLFLLTFDGTDISFEVASGGIGRMQRCICVGAPPSCRCKADIAQGPTHLSRFE
jgi:hypothetical protein